MRSLVPRKGSDSLRVEGVHARIWPSTDQRTRFNHLQRRRQRREETQTRPLDQLLSSVEAQDVIQESIILFHDSISEYASVARHHQCSSAYTMRGHNDEGGIPTNCPQGENQDGDSVCLPLGEPTQRHIWAEVSSSDASSAAFSRSDPPGDDRRSNSHVEGHGESPVMGAGPASHRSAGARGSATDQCTPTERECMDGGGRENGHSVRSAGVQCRLLLGEQLCKPDPTGSSTPSPAYGGPSDSRHGGERRRVSFSSSAAEVVFWERGENSCSEKVEPPSFSPYDDGPPLNFGESVSIACQKHLYKNLAKREEAPAVSVSSLEFDEQADGNCMTEAELPPRGTPIPFNTPRSEPRRSSLRTLERSFYSPNRGRRVSFHEGAQKSFTSSAPSLKPCARNQVVVVAKDYLERLLFRATPGKRLTKPRRPTPWPGVLLNCDGAEMPAFGSEKAQELSQSYLSVLSSKATVACVARAFVERVVCEASTLAFN